MRKHQMDSSWMTFYKIFYGFQKTEVWMTIQERQRQFQCEWTKQTNKQTTQTGNTSYRRFTPRKLLGVLLGSRDFLPAAQFMFKLVFNYIHSHSAWTRRGPYMNGAHKPDELCAKSSQVWHTPETPAHGRGRHWDQFNGSLSCIVSSSQNRPQVALTQKKKSKEINEPVSAWSTQA